MIFEAFYTVNIKDFSIEGDVVPGPGTTAPSIEKSLVNIGTQNHLHFRVKFYWYGPISTFNILNNFNI